MPDIRDMPPDPFEDNGVDPFAVEAAEKLAREDTPPGDPRWDRVGGEPTIDDFDDAERELHGCDGLDPADDADCPTGPFTAMVPWLSAIAVLIVIAIALTYVLR